MSIRLIVPCDGKGACLYFRTPEALLDALELPRDFANLMAAIEIERCVICGHEEYIVGKEDE